MAGNVDEISFAEFIGRLNLELARMASEWSCDAVADPEDFPHQQSPQAWMEHVQTLLWRV